MFPSLCNPLFFPPNLATPSSLLSVCLFYFPPPSTFFHAALPHSVVAPFFSSPSRRVYFFAVTISTSIVPLRVIGCHLFINKLCSGILPLPPSNTAYKLFASIFSTPSCILCQKLLKRLLQSGILLS